MLACLRHAPVSEGCVVALSRGLRPLATFGDPFGIVARVPTVKSWSSAFEMFVKLSQPTVNSSFVSMKSSNGRAYGWLSNSI